MHGNKIFPLIKCMHPDMAGKITGVLLDNNSIAQLISMFEDQDKLKAAVMVVRSMLSPREAATMVSPHSLTQSSSLASLGEEDVVECMNTQEVQLVEDLGDTLAERLVALRGSMEENNNNIAFSLDKFSTSQAASLTSLSQSGSVPAEGPSQAAQSSPPVSPHSSPSTVRSPPNPGLLSPSVQLLPPPAHLSGNTDQSARASAQSHLLPHASTLNLVLSQTQAGSSPSTPTVRSPPPRTLSLAEHPDSRQ